MNESKSSLSGSPTESTHGSQSSSSDCLPSDLIQSLHRQTLAMERLAELLPQLIAQNLMLLEAMGKDEDDTGPVYLDETHANGATGS